MSVLLLLFVCIAIALAQTPARPKIPNGWSATVAVRRTHEVFPRFHRWFYDFTAQKDRLDGLVHWRGEYAFATIIFDHKGKMEYHVFYQEEAVVCYYKALNHTLPKPDFANFVYVGKALIDYVPCWHWMHHDLAKRLVFQVYDRQDNRAMARFDFTNERRDFSEYWTFMEYDAGSQDPTLFEVNPIIKPQCTEFPHHLHEQLSF